MLLWPTPRPALAAAIDILNTAFTPIPVTDRMPKVRPSQIVIVDRIGGGQDNPRMDSARILVEAWGQSTAIAETMANRAREALRNAGGTWVGNGIFVYGWDSEDGVAHYDDPDVTDMRRFQFTGELLVSTRAAPAGSSS